MSTPMIELIVLAGIALFLILRLKNVLGTRDGFEKPKSPMPGDNGLKKNQKTKFEVIEGGMDRDITDHVDEGSDAAKALMAMKEIERDFGVSDFLEGSRGAYEMILMAFENGDVEDVKPFLSEEIFKSFQEGIDARKDKGLVVEANFVGVREVVLRAADLDPDTLEAELTVRFTGELTSVVRDSAGEIIEGDPKAIKKQRDIWTFSRVMGSDDPNWQLVATGE